MMAFCKTMKRLAKSGGNSAKFTVSLKVDRWTSPEHGTCLFKMPNGFKFQMANLNTFGYAKTTAF
jgi:hypothetical protein